MTETKSEIPADEELDWIQLRKELDDIRAKETSFDSYKNNPYIWGGLALTTACFFYGCLNMNHPIKSTLGAYARISSQAITGATMVYWYLTMKKHRKVDLEYHD